MKGTRQRQDKTCQDTTQNKTRQERARKERRQEKRTTARESLPVARCTVLVLVLVLALALVGQWSGLGLFLFVIAMSYPVLTCLVLPCPVLCMLFSNMSLPFTVTTTAEAARSVDSVRVLRFAHLSLSPHLSPLPLE